MKTIKLISWWILFLSFSYGFCERTNNFLLDSVFSGLELGQYIIISLCFLFLSILYPNINRGDY